MTMALCHFWDRVPCSVLQELRVSVSDLIGPPHAQEVSWEQFLLYP